MQCVCVCVSVCVSQSDGLVGTQPEDQIPHEQRYEDPAGIVTDTDIMMITVRFVGLWEPMACSLLTSGGNKCSSITLCTAALDVVDYFIYTIKVSSISAI